MIELYLKVQREVSVKDDWSLVLNTSLHFGPHRGSLKMAGAKTKASPRWSSVLTLWTGHESKEKQSLT